MALLAQHVAAYARINPYLEEYASAAAALEPNATLLPWNYTDAGVGPDGRPLSVRVGPFRHAAGYITARWPGVNLCNYEAATGYFPVLYRPEVDPYDHMGLRGTSPTAAWKHAAADRHCPL